MKGLFLIILIVIVVGGGFYLSKITDNFTNFDKIFDKVYEQVDKNVPSIKDLIDFNNN